MRRRVHDHEAGRVLTIEVGREFETTCDQCGRSVLSTSGFVYRDGDARAIYHTTLHRHAGVPRVDLAIGIGEWANDDSEADVSAFLLAWSDPGEIKFGFVDPGASVWANARLLRNQLTADQARKSISGAELLRIAELVATDDKAVARHLNA